MRANVKKEYKVLANALKKVDFDVTIPKRYKAKQIYVVDNDILEIVFNGIVVRKAKYKADNPKQVGISGIESGSGYPGNSNPIKFSMFEGQDGISYWSGSAKNPKAYLAIWNINKEYSYSVFSKKGIKLKKMDNWQLNFK